MTKSVRLFVLAAAAVAGVLAVTADASAGIFNRRKAKCDPCCASACPTTACNTCSAPRATCATNCNPCGYAMNQSSCCGGVTLAAASMPAPPAGAAPMPLPAGTSAPPAVIGAPIAPTATVASAGCGGCQTVASDNCCETGTGRRFRIFRR